MCLAKYKFASKQYTLNLKWNPLLIQNKIIFYLNEVDLILIHKEVFGSWGRWGVVGGWAGVGAWVGLCGRGGVSFTKDIPLNKNS